MLPDFGYSGFVLEGLKEKGLDAKSYIQTMLCCTEGSSKEEQIIQKKQISAELQRVEKAAKQGWSPAAVACQEGRADWDGRSRCCAPLHPPAA